MKLLPRKSDLIHRQKAGLRNKKKKNKSEDLRENRNKTKEKDKEFNINHHQRNDNMYNKNNYSRDNSYNLKKNNNKKTINNQKKCNSVNNRKFEFRKSNGEFSYALRKRKELEYKKKEHFHPNEEKYDIIKRNIILGRTLPEMIVLNTYRLVNDDDYVKFRNIFNYNKNNKKIKIKRSVLNNKRDKYNDNNIGYNKAFLTPNINIKNNEEITKTSYI